MTDRIHSNTLSKAREHVEQASSLIRSATLARTDVQEASTAKALAELRAAIEILGKVAK